MIEFNNIQVGILIPTFNRKTYLEEALKSACEQTYGNIEIIVIDNGSTDGTAEYMSGIADPRVRYVVNEHDIGMIGSINKGINLFSDEVEWCTILSDDDFLDKDFIKNLLHSAITSAAKSIIHSHRIFIDEQGNRIREAVLSPQEETGFDYMKMRANSKRETYLTGVLFNRTAFREIKGYPAFSTGLASDDAFIFALSLKDRLVFERNTVAYIRMHGGAESISCSGGMRKLDTIKQFGEYCKRVAKENVAFNQKQSRDFESAFKKYLKGLYSYWWIQTAHCAVSQKSKTDIELPELLSITKGNLDKLSFRAKFAVACYTLTGFFPEASRGYRTCWEHIINISQLLRKKILL
jgi:glycosyltransferase involved in cell wall biosynthesis